VSDLPTNFPIADGKVALTCLPQLTLAQLPTTLWSTFQGVRVTETLYIPHHPHGRLTFCSLFAGRRCLRLFRHGHNNVFLDLREHSFICCACSCFKSSHRPDGRLNSQFCLCLQGGGVYVNGGSVTIDSCTISGNTAYVRVHVQKFPWP